MTESVVRRVLIALPGDTSPGISIDPALFDTAPVGPNGETYKALGWEIVAYEDTREPYAPPPAARSAPKPAPEAPAA